MHMSMGSLPIISLNQSLWLPLRCMQPYPTTSHHARRNTNSWHLFECISPVLSSNTHAFSPDVRFCQVNAGTKEMDDVPSVVGFGTGVKIHQNLHDVDVDAIECENQPTEAEALSGSSNPSDASSGNSQPSDGPRAHVQRLGREYGLMAPKRLTASVSNAVDMYVSFLVVGKPHTLLTVS